MDTQEIVKNQARIIKKQGRKLRKARQEYRAIEALSVIRYKAYRCLLADLDASCNPEIKAILEKHRGNRHFFQVP